MCFTSRSRTLKFGALAAIVLILGTIANAQSRGDHLFDQVPVGLRASLVQRLELLIQYESTEQYGRIFDLQSRAETDTDRSRSNEIYVAERQKLAAEWGTLQIFVPTVVMNVTLNDNEPIKFMISGTAKVKRRGHLFEKQMTVFAELEKSDWTFSDLLDSYDNYLKKGK